MSVNQLNGAGGGVACRRCQTINEEQKDYKLDLGPGEPLGVNRRGSLPVTKGSWRNGSLRLLAKARVFPFFAWRPGRAEPAWRPLEILLQIGAESGTARYF